VTTSKAFPESVGSKELKAHLSEFVGRVRQGDRIVVTDRGEPVAEKPSPAWRRLIQFGEVFPSLEKVYSGLRTPSSAWGRLL
jgi:hypothetical protein